MNRLILFLCSLMFAAVCCGADLKPDPLYRSYMVLQRDKVIPLSGKALPGAEVKMTFKNKEYTTTAGKDGRWKIEIPPMKADNKNARMTITSGKEKFIINNVLVGEVILLSGQSHIATSYGYKRSELKSYDQKKLPPEVFKALIDEINSTIDNTETDLEFRSCTVWSDGSASWWKCNPKELKSFSVIGHNLGKILRKELNVPVALISMSRGSSSIESWIPAEYYDHPTLKREKSNIPKFLAFNKANRAKTITPEEIDAYMVDLYNQPRWANWKRNYIKDGKLKPGALKLALFHSGSVQPTACYENITKSVRPYPARFMIWWQGETNYGDPVGDYAQKMRILFESNRKLWNDPDLPIIVILQGQRRQYAGRYSVGRLEQFNGINGLANTYLVNNLLTPIAEIGMIHPFHEKIQAGKDTAALVLKHLFGRDAIGSSPVFDKAEFKDGKAVVSFRFSKGLKTTDGKAPVGFELAGKDKKYYAAEAVIKGECVEVSSEKVASPEFVRFMWEDVKNVCNLVNADNLTAFPFDTQFEFFQKPNTINGK